MQLVVLILVRQEEKKKDNDSVDDYSSNSTSIMALVSARPQDRRTIYQCLSTHYLLSKFLQPT
jgi:hypothetical protein